MAIAMLGELRRMVIIAMCACIVVAAAAIAIDVLHSVRG